MIISKIDINKLNPIQMIRYRANMTQREFCSNFGVPLSTFTTWEQDRSSPSDYVIDLFNMVLDYEETYGILPEYSTTERKDYADNKDIEVVQGIRKHYKMTQTEFCKKFSIPKSTLTGWEQGRVTPSVFVVDLFYRLFAYENHYGILPQYL